uniref:Uncharacterized protein n=1 Tax=Picea sitchensis TaxID=3332 RepID=A0A6B9XXZ4_PICSI|nr:hypothetical protein Q903MT_gene2941 [Picea sitchensis]QHR92834.1 hypothetical protein Q903MT_gene6882 [Picea sitchensis]
MNGGCPSLRLLFSSSPAVTLFFLPQARGASESASTKGLSYAFPLLLLVLLIE